MTCPGPPAGGSPIARLVLEHEPEPSAERGHVERLFPLVEAPALADVERRLGYVASRYPRGCARWFVFDKATVSEEAVTVTGSVRAYNASVDTLSAEPTLSAAPSEAPVELVLRREEALLIARRCTAQIARAAVNALRTATKVRPLGHIPYHVAQLDGSAAALAAPSLFLLDVLADRLRRAGLGPPNLAVARFKLGEMTVEADDEIVRRPTLRAVRFEGDHLLDSTAACRLLAEEGRALVDVAVHIDLANSDAGAPTRFPAAVLAGRRR